MNKSGLLICPQCLSEGKRSILGSVDAMGDFFIKRVQGGTTVIQASSNYTIVCTCGFGTAIHVMQQVKTVTYPLASPNPS